MIQPKGYANLPGTTTPVSASALRSAILRASNWSGQVGQVGPGAGGYEDFRVKQRVAGAAMSVDVGLAGAPNAVFVPEDGAGGTQRYEWSGSQLTLAITPADPALPRIDRVVAEAPVDLDSTAPLISLLAGTPTGGATNDNLSGAAAVAANRVLLADIVVGAAAVSIVAANIRDRRPQPLGCLPTPGTDRDEVAFQFHPAVPKGLGIQLAVTAHDNRQVFVLAFLPRRIVGATRARWHYRQGATAANTNYIIGIYDASGRLIVASSATAFTGALNTYQEAAAVLAATTFEAGWYYLSMGWAAFLAGSSVNTNGAQGIVSAASPGPGQRNLMFRNTTGGTTLPTTMLAATDLASVTADENNGSMPELSLSVG